MYQIDLESIQKLINVNNLLNELQVKGGQNINIMYTVLLSLQQVIQKIQEGNSEDKISVDNTKGG